MGAALVVAACTEPTSAPPRGFVGTFVLQSIDGQAVPTLEPWAPASRVTLVADTIVFDGRGHYTRRDVEEFDTLTGAPEETRSTLDSGTYVVRGDTVAFPIPCPKNAMCSPPPDGVLDPSGELLVVRSELLMDEWRYKHVR